MLHSDWFKRGVGQADTHIVATMRVSDSEGTMKKFSFKLAALQRLRHQEEELVQSELAAALRQEAGIKETITSHRAAEQDLYDYVRTSELSAAELDHVAKYGALQRQRIIDAQIELMRHEETTARIREKLTIARQQREAIDRLEERHRERHRVEMEQEWARELDDIAMQRTAREMAGAGVPTSTLAGEVTV